MPSVEDLIGQKFERDVNRDFPRFASVTKDFGRLTPDFETDDFYVEAKVGYVANGAQLKEYQVKGYPTLDKPLFYFIGFHTLKVGESPLDTIREDRRAAYLGRNMKIQEAFVCDVDVVNAFFTREARISKKKHQIYCLLKQHHLRQIGTNSIIKRNDAWFASQYWYNLKGRVAFREPFFCGQRFSYGYLVTRKNKEKVEAMLLKENCSNNS